MEKRTKGFVSIEKALLYNKNNAQIKAAFYRQKALKSWQAIAGAFIEDSAELTHAVDLKKGVLTIACLSREAAAKLKLLAERIISALNQLIGTRAVFALHIEL
jgi:hypothetical protein